MWLIQTKTFKDEYPEYVTFETRVINVIKEDYKLNGQTFQWVLSEPIWKLIYNTFLRFYPTRELIYNGSILDNYLIIELEKYLPDFYLKQKMLSDSYLINFLDPKYMGVINENAASSDPAENTNPEYNDNSIKKTWQRQRNYHETYATIIDRNITNNIESFIMNFSDLFYQVETVGYLHTLYFGG